MGGEGKIIQADESLMRGRRKYNRGRLLIGDVIDSNVDHNIKRNNYGDRIDGPWVFGFIEAGTRNFRMFYVENRKGETLIPYLTEHVDSESTIHTDQWAGYNKVGDFFSGGHQTVNHSENFVDPVTGAHTQQVECVWGYAKLELLRKKKGVPLTLLQSYLDFYSFTYKYKEIGPFEVFMKNALGKKDE